MKKLDPKQHKAALMQLIEQKKTIEAIKYIRTHTGTGLKEAKNLYNRILADNNFADEYLFNNSEGYSDITGNKTFSKTNIKTIESKTLDLLKSGKKIEAIKYLKESMNTDLKKAKELIDELEVQQNFKPRDTNKKLNTDKTNNKPTDPTAPKYKSSMQTGDKFEDIVFEKNRKRETKRRGSNSGCMLTLVLFIGSGVLISTLLWMI